MQVLGILRNKSTLQANRSILNFYTKKKSVLKIYIKKFNLNTVEHRFEAIT